MAITRSNRLLPLIGGAVALMAAFVGVKSCSVSERDQTLMEKVPRAPAADADTPAETIRTLTARVAEMMANVKALRNENDELSKNNREIEDTVAARVKRDLAKERGREKGKSSSILSALTQRMDALAGRVSSLGQKDPAPAAGGDIPVGLGLDGVPSPLPAIVWVGPLDHAVNVGERADATTRLASRTGSLLRVRRESGPAQDQSDAFEKTKEEEKPLPVFTTPRNATLIGTTAMTALIGRIPVRGRVQDPMPFKLLVGADNLAANGITIPGVEGMVWTGTAVGDWTLSCVTGRLHSVTFVFQDGTIQTISSDDNGEPLGWISDDQGIPCITGERITNAVSFLSQRIAALALQTGADAAALAETTSTISGLTGAGTSTVTGDIGTYVAGKTVAGGAAEIRKWLDERQEQSFDAVFVRPGVNVAIHVDRQLNIDYDPQGRKVSHAANLDPYRRARLD